MTGEARKRPALARVVIVGGGFAGLYAARALRGAPVHVTIVDRRNHHLFQPLLYEDALEIRRRALLACEAAEREPDPGRRRAWITFAVVGGGPTGYRDKGSFATIGRGKAVGVLPGGLHLWGVPAWLAWLAIHIAFLIGFRSRALVLFQWAYSYVTFRRGAGLITGPLPGGAPSRPPEG